MPLDDIPAFLKIPQTERRAEWEARRVAAKALPPEAPPKLKPIPSLPGVPDADADADA